MLLNELDLPPKSACESLDLMFEKSEIVRLGFSLDCQWIRALCISIKSLSSSPYGEEDLNL